MALSSADEVYFRHFLAALETLPSLPPVALEGMKRALKPTTTIQELFGIVELDPPLTAKVLKVANTPFYGKPGRVSSLREAFSILGYPALRSLVLSVSAVELFSDRKEEYGLDLEDLWKHHIGAAVWARNLAETIDPPVDPEAAFISGLLHDIGKVILSLHLKDRYKEVLFHAREKGVPLFKAERDRIGYDHADVSHWLLEQWKIPSLYTQVIFHHHHPVKSLLKNPRVLALCRLVTLADHLCYFYGFGSGGDPGEHKPAPALLKKLALSQKNLDRILTQVRNEVKEHLENLDWEPVSQSVYLPTLMDANRALGEIREQEENQRQDLIRKEKELRGINALGLRLQGCSSNREALSHISETLVTRFPFSEVICTLYLNTKWELVCQAKKQGKAGLCQTLFLEQNREPEPYETRESEGPLLFVDLIGKQGPLGYIKVKPDMGKTAFMDKLGLLLASCARLASEAIERIQSHQQVKRLTETLKRSVVQLDEERTRVEQEKKVKESVFTGIPLGLLLLDEQGHILYFNPEAAKMLPSPASEIGTPLEEIFPDPMLPKAIQEVLDSGSIFRHESKRIDTETDSERAFQWSLVPVWKQAEGEATLLFILDDVTEERTLQKGLFESARMASIGELAAGTAHNLRSPLGAVKGILELLLEEMEAGKITSYTTDSSPPKPTENVKEQLHIILESLNKSFSILDDLLQFARRPDRPPELLCLSELLEGTELLLGELFRERGIRIEKELKADRVFGRKADLIQVFLNLYSNSYKAMPKGGVVKIKSRQGIRKSAGTPSIEIHVEDTGCGISPESIEKIFDPFYTTSDRVEGTGLGLSLTRKIVKEHRGALEVSSKVGEGTVFLLTLPASPDAFLGNPIQPEP